jgi:hypothetical protein
MIDCLDGNHQCRCLQHLQYDDCYQGVTLKAWMCLTAYYLSLLQVHQAHAEQDAPNKGHHQWHPHHGTHLAKQIFGSFLHHFQYNCYQGVTLEAGICLVTYYLNLLQVHQVHAKQDGPNKGNHQWHCSLQVLFALK